MYDKHPMEKISVVVVTFNEELNIERCLGGVQWADEIVVVDAFSTDTTAEICRRMKAKVLQRKWEGFAAQKQFALSSASHEWVLLLDADEELMPEVRTEIERVLSQQPECAGYEIGRKSFFLGQWMKHGGWYPDIQLRLVRKSFASVSQRPVHEGLEVKGKVGRLQGALHHYSYHSLRQYIAKTNDYTSLDVMNKLGLTNRRRVRWYNLIINPTSVFVRMFFALRGFNDGFRGFLLAVYSSIYKLLLYAKTWEYQTYAIRNTEVPPVTDEALNSIKRFS